MSVHYQCLRCWRRMEAEETTYECDACESRKLESWMRPANGTRPKLNDMDSSWWNRFLADGDEKHPVCKIHGTEYRLFCACGQPLSRSSRLLGAKGFALGFAGVYGAGKTLLIATMIDRFRRRKGVSLVGFDDTEKRFDTLTEHLIIDRNRPRGTFPEVAGQKQVHNAEPGQPRNFGWRVQLANGAGKPRQAGLLTVYDVGGETWAENFAQSIDLFDRYLSHLSSLVFLVDGAPMAADLELVGADAWDPSPRPGDRGAKERVWMSSLLERLSDRSQQIDLALAISKADLLWQHPRGVDLKPGAPASLETDSARHEAILGELLTESGRGDLVEIARGRFRRVRLFAVSSLGFTPEAGDVHGDSLTRQLEPADVVEPLRWLFAQRVAGFKR